MDYRSALITGGSSGIGAAFARALPRTTRLVLTGRDATALDALKAGFEGQGRVVDTVIGDLGTDKGREDVIAAGERARIDLLINNAGLGIFGPVPTNDAKAERVVVEVNVVAPVVLTRALLPGMIARAKQAQRRAGVIVVSSISAFLPVPRLATYAASKAFDLHYAEALAADMEGEPVDVLALCPGFTATKFGERAGMKPWMFRFAADPEEVARRAIEALGRRRVLTIGGGSILAPLAPRLLPRKFLSGAVVWAMKRLKSRSGS